jgi:hypothetical protein
MAETSFDSLFEDFELQQKEASHVLSKAHKHAFNILQNSVDALSSKIFSLIHENLKILKTRFPNYHIVFTPLTETWGNDIGPTYGIKIKTKWMIFAILKNTTHTLDNRERIHSIKEIYEQINNGIDDFYIWEKNLYAKLSNVDANVVIREGPPASHIEVILNHGRFK